MTDELKATFGAGDEVSAGLLELVQASEVASVTFSIRKADGGTGVPAGFEDLPAHHNATTGFSTFKFDTLQLPDGYYVVVIRAVDNEGNSRSLNVPYSIRNWVILNLLPATPTSKGGRTLPVKFSLRISAAVDSDEPFVCNEDLTIKIFASTKPGEVMQTSLFGEKSRDYRIDDEKYITNFQTDKVPTTYTVQIWRTGQDFLVGSFMFTTTR